MTVRNRIKILECKSFEEVENKVNDFLAFDEDIEHVSRIEYKLEYNVVIVEYYVFGQEEKRGERKGKEIILTEEYYSDDLPNTIIVNPFVYYWYKFFFPTL